MFDILPGTLNTKSPGVSRSLKYLTGKVYIPRQTADTTGNHFVAIALIHVAADAYTNLLGPCFLDQLQDFSEQSQQPLLQDRSSFVKVPLKWEDLSLSAQRNAPPWTTAKWKHKQINAFSLRSWRYCDIKVLDPKKGVGTRRLKYGISRGFAARNLTRQRLRCQVSRDHYTIPPATQVQRV